MDACGVHQRGCVTPCRRFRSRASLTTTTPPRRSRPFGTMSRLNPAGRPPRRWPAVCCWSLGTSQISACRNAEIRTTGSSRRSSAGLTSRRFRSVTTTSPAYGPSRPACQRRTGCCSLMPSGNDERLTFLYDADKVTLVEEIGEVAPPPSYYPPLALPCCRGAAAFLSVILRRAPFTRVMARSAAGRRRSGTTLRPAPRQTPAAVRVRLGRSTARYLSSRWFHHGRQLDSRPSVCNPFAGGRLLTPA